MKRIVTKQNKPSKLTPISLSVKINLVCQLLRRLLVWFAYLSCISCKSTGDNITHVVDLPVLKAHHLYSGWNSVHKLIAISRQYYCICLQGNLYRMYSRREEKLPVNLSNGVIILQRACCEIVTRRQQLSRTTY